MTITKETYERWFETTLGQYLLEQEQALFDRSVQDVFGFHAVQLNMPALDCLKNSRIPSTISAGEHCGDLQCESTYLPFAENSIDLLCLPHVLEFSDNPHQTLREAARVLVPEGYVIISAFNPYSLWGLKKVYANKQDYPWLGQFFPLYRVKDWLALLGLEVVKVHFLSYEPPFKREHWIKRFKWMHRLGSRWWPMMGGQFIIVAKKRVVNITLLKPKWKRSLLKPDLAVSGHKKHEQQKAEVVRDE